MQFVSFLRLLGICGRPVVPLRGPLILHGNSFLDGDEVQFSCIANYDLLEVKKVDVLPGNEIQAYQSAKVGFFLFVS